MFSSRHRAAQVQQVFIHGVPDGQSGDGDGPLGLQAAAGACSDCTRIGEVESITEFLRFLQTRRRENVNHVYRPPVIESILLRLRQVIKIGKGCQTRWRPLSTYIYGRSSILVISMGRKWLGFSFLLEGLFTPIFVLTTSVLV